MQPPIKIILKMLVLLPSLTMTAQCVNIRIVNIRDTSGMLCLALYNDASSYNSDCPIETFKYNKRLVQHGELTLSLFLKEGIYGIAILDDENNNGKMEYDKLGFPKEGFGFSDYDLRGLRRPCFSDFDFAVKDSCRNVMVRMKYM